MRGDLAIDEALWRMRLGKSALTVHCAAILSVGLGARGKILRIITDA